MQRDRWEADESKNGSIIVLEGKSPNREVIAVVCSSHRTGRERLQDAKLIAAAPALHAELKNLYDLLDTSVLPTEVKLRIDTLLQMLEE